MSRARNIEITSRIVLSGLLALGLIARATASNSLPPTQAAFGAAYEITDATTGNSCYNKNTLTNSCACPGGTPAAADLRVINDSGGAGTQRGGHFMVCSSGAPSGSSEFYGTYQQDDAVAGGLGCRRGNAITGACSCPAGTVDVSHRTLADSSAGIIGSNIHVCTKVTSAPVSFGGSYEITDGNVCKSSNPMTGACSCPATFTKEMIRTQVDVTGGFTGATITMCVPPMQWVTICPGNTADPTGKTDVSAQINNCINATPSGGTLALPAGTYQVNSPIVINKPMSIRTQGVADTDVACGKSSSVPCATFVSSSTFSAANGLLQSDGMRNVVIDHVVVDGNRFDRLGSASASACAADHNQYGFNASVTNCATCTFQNSVSERALCGTGLQWSGSSATIKSNSFVANGDHFTHGLWSDGLTLVSADNGTISNNTAADNSDVGLIIGSSSNARVTNNMVTQTRGTAFAAFMLFSFSTSADANFTGATFSGNTINCSAGKCFYAVAIGNDPWLEAARPGAVYGGSFINNAVTGGVIGINAAGAGTSSNPVTVSGNTIATSQPDSPSNACVGSANTVASSRFNRAPDAVIAGTQVVSSSQGTVQCLGP